METSINSAWESSQAIDSLANDLSTLMGNAFVLLRRCQSKLLDFKLIRQAGRGKACEILESEIASLLASTAGLYRQASAKARVARTVFDAVIAQAVPCECCDADAVALLSACRQTGESLAAFERLIAEFGRQLEADLDVFRKASSVPDVTPQATSAFDRLMNKVMSRQRDRAA